jgi:hypothetical protein
MRRGGGVGEFAVIVSSRKGFGMTATRKAIGWLRAACAITSAILFIVVIGIWIRSYFVSDWIRFMHASVGPEREVIENGHLVTHEGDQFETE